MHAARIDTAPIQDIPARSTLRRLSSANRLRFTLERIPCAGCNPVRAECAKLRQGAQARAALPQGERPLPRSELRASGVRNGPTTACDRVDVPPSQRVMLRDTVGTVALTNGNTGQDATNAW